ncbi:MAG: Holliday junction branch migration protein RuvA [Bacteroidetes bacterium]|nr:Holliday junction branch migration protein RuvA [Bacteroidota bacterium]MDA1119435.1 Holliday junction branch migration protein RuvA [Bacteroidota bacterium]
MISYLEGKLVSKEPGIAIMDVNGVGYEVRISLNTYSTIKDLDKSKLHTHLHIKEDAHTLYGFSDPKEKKRFLDLISISGVGPATGLMILSSLSPEELQNAILNNDVRTIQSVKGIGGKTAERVILELKDKMRKEEIPGMEAKLYSETGNTLRNEALSALITLGISRNAAEKSVVSILKTHGADISLEELIKLALKSA